MLESFKALDAIRLNFSQDGLFALNLTLAVIMFGVALGIKLVHFKALITDPKSVIVGFLSQFVALPFITFLIVLLFRNYITPTIGLGMILVSACPGGNISNFMTSLAKGNAALSVGLTAIATMAALVLTPLNFSIYGKWFISVLQNNATGDYVRPLSIDAIQMFKTVFIILGIPLITGMLFNHYLPRATKIIIKPLQIISIILFLAMVVILFMGNDEHFLPHIKYIFLIVLVHNAVAFFTGYSLSRITNRPPADQRAISIETGIQNSGLGLVLLFNPKIFPPELALGGMAFVTAWWGIWHILSGLTLAGTLSFIPFNKKTE